MNRPSQNPAFWSDQLIGVLGVALAALAWNLGLSIAQSFAFHWSVTWFVAMVFAIGAAGFVSLAVLRLQN
jgi:hypothetical protein